MTEQTKTQKVKAQIIDLLKSSAIVQGSIALVSTGTVSYMYATGKPVPVELVGIVMVIIGYYFGTKSQQNSNREEK